MPQTKPLSEFNRNQMATIDEPTRTQEPLCSTHRSSQFVVVYDIERTAEDSQE